MWIVSHEGDPRGELRCLSPETNYMIGRDDSADFLFHSQKSSRELIELITGESNQNKTRLILRIMSRAKSIINDKIYKLKNKFDKPQEIEFTKENKIIIKCSNNLNDESQLILPDTPIKIKWIEFKIFLNSIDNNSYIKQIQEQKIDIILVDNIYNATHYYSNGKDEDSDNFKIAIIRGIPVLNSNWLKLILNKNSDLTVGNWLLNIDIKKWLPNNDQDYLPSSRINLFNDVKLISTERIKWIDTIVIDINDIEQEIKKKIKTEEEFIFISNIPVDNLQCITKDQLWNYIKNNSIQGLPRNSIKFLKRPASEPAVEESHPVTTTPANVDVDVSPDRPKSRKRRKYEKVDKLHFFSLANTDSSPPPPLPPLTTSIPVDSVALQNSSSINTPQVRATPEVIKTIDSDDTSNTKDFTPSDEGRSLPDSQDDNEIIADTVPVNESVVTVERQSNEKETPSTVRLESLENESQLGEDSNHIGQKRKLESIIDEKPKKLGKFIPKVTLAEAVYQVKESNKSEIIEFDKNIENLKNLTIVEVIDLIPRINKKKKNFENNEILYSGRKNFKRFKKPEKKINRRKIGLYTVEDKLIYRNNNQDQDDDEEDDGDEDEDEENEENELRKSSQFKVGQTTQSKVFETNSTPKKRIGLFLNDDDDSDED